MPQPVDRIERRAPENDTSGDAAKQVDAVVGRRLKLRRTLLGLTQEQVALACDLSYQQIHKYETGQSRMSTARLVQFSSVLDAPVSWFFEGLDHEDPLISDGDYIQIDKATARLIALTQRIKSKKRLRQLVDFAKLLADEDV